MKNLSTRDALLLLRKVVSADAERGDKVRELSKQLDAAVTERSTAVEEALGTLESYLAIHTKLHGFTVDLGAAPSAFRQTPVTGYNTNSVSVTKTAKTPKTSKTSKVKKKTVKRSKSKSGRNGGPQVPTGWKGTLARSISLSSGQRALVDVLTEKWPTFVTPKSLVRGGVISNPSVVSATINRMRNKGVPLESARQARTKDETLSTKTRGYRLVGS